MNKIKKSLFIIIILVSIFFTAVWLLSPILLPFISGIIIAYLLDPVVDYIETKKINRIIATSLSLLLFLGIIITLILLIIPVIISQIYQFITNYPTLIDEVKLEINKLLFFLENKINVSAENLFEKVDFGSASLLIKLINRIISSSLFVVNIFGLIIVTPVVSWYLLKDWDKIKNKIYLNIPKSYLNIFKKSAHDIDQVLSSFIRGQLIVCFILAIYYSLGLSIIGLDYSLVIGLFIGVISLVPYLGFILGIFIATLLGLLQFTNTYYLMYILFLFLLGQIVEGNYLTPKLIGDKLGLHPVMVIFSIFAFGSLFGIIGVIMAIPTSAVLFVLLKKLNFKQFL